MMNVTAMSSNSVMARRAAACRAIWIPLPYGRQEGDGHMLLRRLRKMSRSPNRSMGPRPVKISRNARAGGPCYEVNDGFWVRLLVHMVRGRVKRVHRPVGRLGRDTVREVGCIGADIGQVVRWP